MPALLLCLVAAVLRYRLQEIDGVLRRSLLQVVVATLIGTVFLAVAAAIDLATDNSFWAVVAGGLVALVLVPLALGLRRTVSQFVYGDRDYPYRVVSELRRLDPRTTPTEALRDMLTLLARRLRLSYASIEVYASTRRTTGSRPRSAARADTRPRSCSRWVAPPSDSSSSR